MQAAVWLSPGGLFVPARMPQRKSYIRDDGAVRIEIRPHVYVEEEVALRLGQLRERESHS